MASDIRDPESLGDALLTLRDQYEDVPLSRVYDMEHYSMITVPSYDPAPVDHAADYKRELEERAAEGDIYAQRMLRGDGPLEEGER